MTAYYNEFDRGNCAWLENLMAAGLITPGLIDERPIQELRPDDLVGFDRVHLFAGIAGWDLALQLAGWRDAPVWTGSAPCQPYSSATRGRGKRAACERHLWPEMRRLIAACRPAVVFGEQVASAGDWLDGVCDDMEAVGYAVRACVLPAFCVAADHARERIYFACDADGHGEPRLPVDGEAPRLPRLDGLAAGVVLEDGFPAGMAYRGFGNAVVPQLAAEFIQAYREVIALPAGAARARRGEDGSGAR